MKRRPKPPAPEEDPAADPNAILQVKFWLTGISPMVWRRVLATVEVGDEVVAASRLRTEHVNCVKPSSERQGLDRIGSIVPSMLGHAMTPLQVMPKAIRTAPQIAVDLAGR